MRFGLPRKRRKLPFIIVLLLLFAVSFLIVTARLGSAFASSAHAYANAVATAAVSRAVYETFSEYSGETFSEAVSGGNAVTFNTDTARLNMINSVLTDNLEKKVALEDYHTIYLPLGAVTGINSLSGAGPKVPVKIHPVNIVNTDFDEKFESAGINQVRHSVFINVEIKMAYSGYMFFTEETVNVKVPVTDTVIVGDTPKYYGGGGIAVNDEK